MAFRNWHAAMESLTDAHTRGVPSEISAAVRRAGETHEAVLRAIIVEVDRMRVAVSKIADGNMAAISSETERIDERLDGHAGRIHDLETMTAQLRREFDDLMRSYEREAA